MGKRVRPIKQRHPPKGIDPRTDTRLATPEEKAVAQAMARDLEENVFKCGLAPAPDPHFDGHKIRVLEQPNPKWYQRFVAGRWDSSGCQVRRSRIEKALRRVIGGRVRGNGYEVELLKIGFEEGLR